MRRDKCNRYNCPSIFVVILMNPQEDYPNGGARPFNGGFNTGGGIVIMSSYGLDQNSCFQSTLQHELGHAFGLPHVDVYSYDMAANPSLMSYNPGHHTNGFQPSATPGAFIPEDVRALALNRRAFPHLRYNAEKDCPPGYSITKRTIGLGPMHFPGEPEVLVTTTSGEAHESSVSSIVQGCILPNEKFAENADGTELTFDPGTMWQSDRTSNGWASVQITFPFEVELTKVAVHSQHGGKHDAAEAVRIAVKSAGRFSGRRCQSACVGRCFRFAAADQGPNVAVLFQSRRERIGRDSRSSVLLGQRRDIPAAGSLRKPVTATVGGTRRVPAAYSRHTACADYQCAHKSWPETRNSSLAASLRGVSIPEICRESRRSR